MNKIFLFLLIGWMLFIASGDAGQLHPAMAQKIRSAQPDEFADVLIIMDTGSAAPGLKKRLALEYRTNRERHLAGLMELKARADESQAGIIESLESFHRRGLVENVRRHWIINAVSARARVNILDSLKNLPGVYEIAEQPSVELIAPVKESGSFGLMKAAVVEDNIMLVGADSAWKLGYDGTGTIVCSFDTGVEGDHPALANSWQGNYIDDPGAAWFDPLYGETFPHTFTEAGEVESHGTATMGIIVGYDETADHHIGVAPGATWISAAVIDLPYASIIEAFEWAADPDGDPNTYTDVPAVINHSWGISNSLIGCSDYFWQMIDNIEALGIVNIFAGGNDGPYPHTLANPANRAQSELDCFAVGAFSPNSTTKIWDYSSRGPSDCDFSSIKPNVVAPGVNILSSGLDGGYEEHSGTSMAAPHVSGAVAILRQYAPDATPDEIKEALLQTCTPYPDETSEPNNNFGWGLINIPAAIEYLTPQAPTNLRIYSFDYDPVGPGEIASGDVVISNSGEMAENVYALVTGEHDGLDIITDSLYFGAIDSGQTATGHTMFEAAVHETVEPGTILSVALTIYADGGYSTDARLYIKTGEIPPAGSIGFFTHETGKVSFTISNFGQYGFANGSYLPLDYSGFMYDGGGNDLFEAAFMVGIDENHVSDGARNFANEPDNDFTVAHGGDLTVNIPGSVADAETGCLFSDSKAENPIGLVIDQKTLSWSSSPDDDFIILQFVIQNNGETAIDNIFAGLYFDWDIGVSYNNIGGFSENENLGYMSYYDGAADSTDFRGLAVLNPEGVYSCKLRVYTGVNTWSEANKFIALSSGVIDQSHPDRDDLSQIISTGPFNLGPGQIDTAAFAVAASDDLAGIKGAADRARVKYESLTDVEIVETGKLPANIELYQNYPNPFNPVTAISFSLNVRCHVNLTIYNILGMRVREMVDEELAAGKYRISWDGTDGRGKSVGSGVYFYALKAGGRALSRKMILIK